MNIPEYVKKALSELHKAGFEAYAVGGCVRDSLLGKVPHDWDLCTSALPEQVEQVFESFHVIETGLKHGTVTVRIDHKPIEITTFRKDGDYLDRRRPENVEFVSELSLDLSRRDFTVNALAYSENSGITDLFGGRNDLENKLIRCVGSPEKRFGEDALRILRALRFSSVLGFEIEEKTAQAVHKMKELLKEISAERIREELLKLLCGVDVGRILTDYKDVIAVIIPEISEEFGFLQHNPHHCYDVYLHTVKAVENVKNTPALRLTMLLHDIGKPRVFRLDENGVGHFKLHPTVGSEMAKTILRRLKFDNKTLKYVTEQIWEHDNRFPTGRKNIRRFISNHGFDFYFDHLEIRLADTLAQSDFMREKKLEELCIKREIGEELLAESAKLTLSDIEINGRDIIALGVEPGREIKEILSKCLSAVVDETVPNSREDLVLFAKKIIEEKNRT